MVSVNDSNETSCESDEVGGADEARERRLWCRTLH